VIAVTSSAQRDPSGDIADAGEVSAANVALGDCLNDLQESTLVFSVSAVPCSEPHEGQVYAVFNLSESAWPGEERLFGLAEQGCADHLARDFVAAYEDESVEIFFLHPTSGSWREGDREVVCIARYLDGKRRGSLLD
jgi:hypothetical protein